MTGHKGETIMQVRIIGNESTGYRAVLASDNSRTVAFGRMYSDVLLIVRQQRWEVVRG